MENETVKIKGKNFEIRHTVTNGDAASATVRGNTILIKIPPRLNREEAYKAFINLKDRVVKHIRKSNFRTPGPVPIVFHDGQKLSIMGKDLAISVKDGFKGLSTASAKHGNIIIILAYGLTGKERDKHINVLARRVISRQLLPDVRRRVDELNSMHFKFSFGKVRIKAQTTRWGSYSQKTNSINLSFRLLFAPPDVLDAVIIHELAHVKELNHSDRFWRLVLGAVPDYKEKRKWLNKNGNQLGIAPDQLPLS